MPKRILTGVVVSDKEDKTIRVNVDRRVQHKKYKKIIKRSKKYSVHDETNKSLAFYLSEITLDPSLPTPIGVLYKEDKPTYNDMMIAQIDDAIKTKGEGDLKSLLHAGHTWEVS